VNTAGKNGLLVLIVFTIGTGLLLRWLYDVRFPWTRSDDSANSISKEISAQRAWLQAREDEADKTVWSKELLAQSCGRVFESLWDSVNASTNKLAVIARFPVSEIVLGKWTQPKAPGHGIELREPLGRDATLGASEWPRFIENFVSDGWQLENLEFRHNRFDTDANGQPRESHFYFAARLTHSKSAGRAMVEGDLIVAWAPKRTAGQTPAIKRIDASRLTLKTRLGEPPLKPVLRETITPPERSPYIDPLIVYDLDGDGLPEIILAEKNLVYRYRGEDRYESEPLCRHAPELITSAVIADFDGDGSGDLLCASSRGLSLFTGSPQGRFDEPPRLAWSPNPALINTMVLTCGDIDHDGDLDVFLGQYRVPDLGQVLRPYYYDANDGWPAYLLLNDGRGNLTDATEAAGLAPKRFRRVYSASLADLNDDRHLDLAVISDFAGLDLYQNDGRGHFTDVTGKSVAESHAFGMAHALADFNVDGRLDLLMIGMPSPTVDRLEHLGLRRFYSTEDHLRRPAMTFGNRLYLARPTPLTRPSDTLSPNGGEGKVEGALGQKGTPSNLTFEQAPLNHSIARSGWSWGCSAFDFDNDGFPDVYIANGLESKQSVRDYESEFWLHDIFVDEKIDDVTATGYLVRKFDRTRGAGWSYGGYEKNRLYLNQRGPAHSASGSDPVSSKAGMGWAFVEIGHLAGVALEQDSRNVVAADLDADGRMDLLVTTLEVWPEAKQILQVFKNTLQDSGHWIGFRFREEGAGKSPVGARVTIHFAGRKATQQIVTGDSHRSQHPNTVHFGLGAAERVERVEISWPNGAVETLSELAADRYYEIKAR
jgi:hypothetical protein